MSYRRSIKFNIEVAVFWLLLSPAALALNIETGVGVGLGYTDNAALTASNEEDDWMTEAFIGAAITQATGSLNARADISYNYQQYLNDTFNDQGYLDIGALLDWEQVRDRLTWKIRDYFYQSPVNSLTPDTPDNVQDTNAFSFGPEIYFQLTPRSSLTINPLFQDYHYSESDTDNQQLGVAAGWLYKMYPTISVGLNGAVTRVSYDNEALNPDYTINSLYGVVSGTRPRSEYKFMLGATRIDRDRAQNVDGATGGMDWLFHLTGKSTVRAYLLSDLTDASRSFFGSAVDPGTGDPANVQVSGDVMRSNTARLAYSRQGTILDTQLWAELRDLDYKTSQSDDRKVQELGAMLAHRISPLLTAGVDGRYTKTRQTTAGRTDKEYSIGGNLVYQLSRKLHCNLNVRYRDKASTLAVDEYSEASVFAGLVYGFGNLRSFIRY